MSSSSSVHLFGIRHHGPGSARSLRAALEALQPTIVLVEGPPDAEGILPLLADPAMEPPVALLTYAVEHPELALIAPFAEFSPEWQAFRYANEHGLPLRLIDLPIANQLAMPEIVAIEQAPEAPENPETPETAEVPETPTEPERHTIGRDPLGWLAEAAGYSDSEQWWEALVEQRRDSRDLFAAIHEAMQLLRSEVPAPPAESAEAWREPRREAHMRQAIRAAQREGFSKIAVVCGAWHTPALVDLAHAKADAALLKGMPKLKVQSTWIPWNYPRLAFASGYRAGITAPGWYEHLWRTNEGQAVVPHWLSQAAHLLRAAELDVSSASVIEAVRLAETLSAMRDQAHPGLAELNEAVQTIFCFGESLPLQLIEQQLLIGTRIGAVPPSTPLTPLQTDVEREQKRLRLAFSAQPRELVLDLRKPLDLDRSHFLYRLQLLGVPWGEPIAGARNTGTFRETWQLAWQPEMAIELVTKSLWGNTLAEAATHYASKRASESAELSELSELLNLALLAELPAAVEPLLARLQALSVATSDVGLLMKALPALGKTLRYGNVRQTDTAAVDAIVGQLLTRICVGLPNACVSLDESAAEIMLGQFDLVEKTISVLNNEPYEQQWRQVLRRIVDLPQLPGLLGGRTSRLLFDAKQFDQAELARRLNLALSTANDPHSAAAWITGLLRGSGLLLIHDRYLLSLIDGWIRSLSERDFPIVLPLLRRSFSAFAPAERRQINESLGRGPQARPAETRASESEFDPERAAAVLPLISQLLGLNLASAKETEGAPR